MYTISRNKLTSGNKFNIFKNWKSQFKLTMVNIFWEKLVGNKLLF